MSLKFPSSSSLPLAYINQRQHPTIMVMITIILLGLHHGVQSAYVFPGEKLPVERECIPPLGFNNCSESALKFPGRELNVTVLLPFSDKYKASMKRVAQAIFLGFQKVREDQMLHNYQVLLSYKDSNCSNMNAPLAFVEDVFLERAMVFFGPSCELALGMCNHITYKHISS